MSAEFADTTDTIHLDETSIEPSELSISTLMREIGLQSKPHWLLVKMMNPSSESGKPRASAGRAHGTSTA